MNKLFHNKQWVSLFSQTGTEIVSLAKYYSRFPDTIITSNADMSKWNVDIPRDKVIIIDRKNTKNSYVLKKYFDTSAIITLHGWLHIIPKDICEDFCIYNGHPGYIVDYPELKGKDPQDRVWRNFDLYDKIGSVVHRVTPIVDDGEIISSSYVLRKSCCWVNMFSMYDKLKATSLQAWIKAFSIIQ